MPSPCASYQDQGQLLWMRPRDSPPAADHSPFLFELPNLCIWSYHLPWALSHQFLMLDNEVAK